MNPYTNILRKYESGIRDAILYRDRNEEKTITQALKLQEEIDWSFIATALDVIGDTNLAVQYFLDNGFEVNNNQISDGEKYLHLYGVLNATYLQQEAIKVLCEKFHMKNGNLWKQSKIREIRNKIGSHSSDYKNGKESYVVIRNSISGFTFEFKNNQSQEYTYINLKDDLEEHIKSIIYYVDILYEQTICILYKENELRLKEELNNLSNIRQICFLPFRAITS